MKLFKSNFSFFRCLLAVASIFCITSCSSPDEENTIVGSNSAKVEATTVDYSLVMKKLTDSYPVGSPSPKANDDFGVATTDCADEVAVDPETKKTINDGDKFRAIIKAYDSWYKANKKGLPQKTHPTLPETTITSLKKLFGNSDYTNNDKTNYVKQIVKYYNATYALNGKVGIPTTTNATLLFLESRHQCKAFLNKVVKDALKLDAPTYQGRAAYILKIPANIQKGMLLYNTKRQHCGFVVDFQLSADKTSIVWVKIREANWGKGQEANPTGQLPWERTIGERTSLYTDAKKKKQGDPTFILSDYDIVKLSL